MSQVGLLFLRVYMGGMMLIFHGWPKFSNFSQYTNQFMDFMGLGPTISLGLAVFAEVVCAAMVVMGLFTRFATVPLMVTMLVAAFVVHAQDPFHKQEFALMYFAGYFAIFLSGSGKYSLQHILGLTSTSRWKSISFFFR